MEEISDRVDAWEVPLLHSLREQQVSEAAYTHHGEGEGGICLSGLTGRALGWLPGEEGEAVAVALHQTTLQQD